VPLPADGRAAAAGEQCCTRRTIRVSRQWLGWQHAPRPVDGRAAAAGRVGSYPAGHLSLSSMAQAGLANSVVVCGQDRSETDARAHGSGGYRAFDQRAAWSGPGGSGVKFLAGTGTVVSR